jgi:hypothetical protein
MPRKQAKSLTLDKINEVVAGMPETASASQLVDFFVTVINAYSIKDQWLPIAISVGYILRELSVAEEELEKATKH